MNILKGDRIALPTGHRSPRGTFHVRFALGKRLTVNVFRQRMNQLFQGVEDIWRAIAKYSLRAIALHPLWAIALSDYPPIPSQGKNLNVLRGAHLGTFPRILLKGKLEHTEGRSLSSRHISCSVPVRENIDGKRFPSKDKSFISRG
ncbi:hypothetical protein [Cylindrospermopsis raciborskii]|uniref:hypothetical protein n=1 Tax=Cylindrospermopsis raciborskii TaxID=77022 RepID=UPI002155D79F|nr:hypothetical protein [Cylindrospermopsis raciborskii]